MLVALLIVARSVQIGSSLLFARESFPSKWSRSARLACTWAVTETNSIAELDSGPFG